MKTIFLSTILVAAFGTLLAQTQLNKAVPVAAGQTIDVHFDYPNLVRVSTWDKHEVMITGTVSINGGESDDAFELETTSSGNRVSVSNHIKNMKSLPHRITVWENGQKTVFKDKQAYQKFKSGGGGFERMSDGVDMDIVIEIKVPQNTSTKVTSVYGMVEVTNFTGPIDVEATYGGVDAALTERFTGELTAETNYGEIYSNLDAKFSNKIGREENFHTFVVAKPGAGPAYSFESRYGKVYLRKATAQ